MNIRLVDGWTILHFLFASAITIFLSSKGLGFIYTVLIVVIWEMVEHSFIGDMVFEWAEAERKEVMLNSIIDIMIGIIAVIITWFYIMPKYF